MTISDWAETVCLDTECQILPQDGPINGLMSGRRWFLGEPGTGWPLWVSSGHSHTILQEQRLEWE